MDQNHNGFLEKYCKLANHFNKPAALRFLKSLGYTDEQITKSIGSGESMCKDVTDATQEKVKHAKSYLRYVYILPFVEMIALSGSIGAGTARKEDDIDVFVICTPGYLWLTRALDYILLNLLNVRRNSNSSTVRDKIDTNYYLSSGCLELREKDFFTGFQALTLKTLYGKERYKTFIESNEWLKGFFATEESWKSFYESNVRSNKLERLVLIIKRALSLLLYPLLFPLNGLAKGIQVLKLRTYSESLYSYDKTRIQTFPKCIKSEVSDVLS